MKSVLEYLEKSEERFPDKLAVIDVENKCTYKELLNNSKKIGSFLIPYIQPKQPVVCFMDKSIFCLQAFFGIVYASGFYTLIDPNFPEERIQQILNTLNPALILTNHSYDEKIGKLGNKYKKIYVEEIDSEIDEISLLERRKSAFDINPLYCNFTSGSTGTPKGVLVGHRSVIDFIDVFTEKFGMTEDDVIGNQAPFDFDVSVKDIYSTMKIGGTLVIIPRSYFMSPTKVIDMLEDNKVTTMIWAVSALCMLIRLHGFNYKVPKYIKRIMFSGEVMPIKQFNKLGKIYPKVQFVNLYGPTEITCNCTYQILNNEYSENEKIPIGIPFDNEEVFLLNEKNEISKDGEKGEICVSGTALALGYYNNPEMTTKNFMQNPLNKNYLETIYRTGDLAVKKDGVLYFAGRKDFQIKHMGHRIELEEIESKANKISELEHVCCIYDQNKNKIVMFYKGNIDKVTIINNLKKELPDYMIPNVFMMVDSMPLNKNGKTDRKALTTLYEGGK